MIMYFTSIIIPSCIMGNVGFSTFRVGPILRTKNQDILISAAQILIILFLCVSRVPNRKCSTKSLWHPFDNSPYSHTES